MKNIAVCLLSFIYIIIAGCTPISSDIPKPQSAQSITQVLELTSPQPESALQNKTDLDLRQPAECMLFLEMVLEEVETEKGLKLHNILDYCREYTVQHFKNKDRNSCVFIIESGPSSQIYVIADANTKEYVYFDVPKTYRMLTFDHEKARFTCQSGSIGQQFNNFPYEESYRYADKQWQKIYLPISNDHYYYKLGGNPASFGTLDRIELTAEKANVVFSFDELLAQDPSLGSALPILHYWFDPVSNKATLSFSGIEFTDAHIVSSLEQLPGITNVQIALTDAIDLEAQTAKITKATQITFYVSEEYHLYGEYENTRWDCEPFMRNNEMSFWLWVERK